MSEPMTLRARVAVPLKEVHYALTDPQALRTWLAEHAEVDLPHRYEFWGRYTPDGERGRQRLLHVDDTTLRFSWLLGGEETTTEIRLSEESSGSTILTLSQSHFDLQDAMTGRTIRGVLQTFWYLATANLVDYLEGRELTPKCDFTSSELRGWSSIDAPREAVFGSLVDSEQVTRWFGYRVEIEPYVGGRFAMGGFEAGQAAKIIDLDPGRRLSTDWAETGITTWELEDSGGGTRLTFIQSGFDTERPPYAGWMGWLSGMAELRRYHELSDWSPIWLDNDAPEGAAATG
ncbi:SRPBCC family protein [Sphaerisporangium sp. NPDC049002]|uniref:SRPBCC family protein n=1 Tax=unclassified Sphaerisporangium TaxID=2630420 RepID=UPI0033C1D495